MESYLERCKAYLNSNTPGAIASKIILVTIALGGVVVLATIAPNIGAIFRGNKRGKRIPDKKYRNAFYSLKRNGYIHVTKKDGRILCSLSPKGIEKAKGVTIDAIIIPKVNHWDGLWRIVSFDIPINQAKGRQGLRFKLKQLGFVQLHKSTWVHPYPCEGMVNDIAAFWRVINHTSFITGNIANDKKLRQHFKI